MSEQHALAAIRAPRSLEARQGSAELTGFTVHEASIVGVIAVQVVESAQRLDCLRSASWRAAAHARGLVLPCRRRGSRSRPRSSSPDRARSGSPDRRVPSPTARAAASPAPSPVACGAQVAVAEAAAAIAVGAQPPRSASGLQPQAAGALLRRDPDGPASCDLDVHALVLPCSHVQAACLSAEPA